MLNMLDAVLAVVLLGIVLYGFTTLRTDLSDVGDAQRIAYAYTDMHDSLQTYLDSYYPQIERCLGGDRWAAAWRDRQLRFRRGDTGAARPPDHSTFIPLPLFSDTRLTGTPGRFASLSPADGLYGGPSTGGAHAAHLRVMPAVDCLPPVAFGGTLAPSFRSLEYERGATPSAHLFDDRYDFRAAVRLINTDRTANIIDPTVAVQIILVMRTPPAEPLPLAKALRIAELTRKPDVGILSSLAVGAAAAESTLAGVGDGWRMTVCVPPALELAAETTAERTRLATPPPAPTPLSGLGLGGPADVAARTALQLPACGAGAWLGSDVLPVYGIFQTSPVARLFQSGAGGALQERFSGQPVTNANAPHAARVVSVIEKSRTAGLRDLFFRTAIPGMPERQRMEADIDMGAYGVANVGFITGVDTDGDGLVNQGVQIIGPHPSSRPSGCVVDSGDYRLGCPDSGTGAGTRQANLVPTTFHGDVHIRGALVITDPETDFPQSTAATADNFPAGSLVVAGPTFFGPRDPADLLALSAGSTGPPSELNVEAPRTVVAVAAGVTTTTTTSRRVFRSAGALRAGDVDNLAAPSAGPDAIHLDTGVFHLTAEADARTHGRPAILIEAGPDATGNAGGTTAMLFRNRSTRGDMRIFARGAGQGIHLRSDGANAPVQVGTTGAASHLRLDVSGAGSHAALRARSPASRLYLGTGPGHATDLYGRPGTSAGGMTIETSAPATRLLVSTRGAGSPLSLWTHDANSPLTVETRQANSPLEVETDGASSPLEVQTQADGSLLRLRTAGVGSPAILVAGGASSDATVRALGGGSAVVRSDHADGGVQVFARRGGRVDVFAGNRLPATPPAGRVSLYTLAAGANVSVGPVNAGSVLDLDRLDLAQADTMSRSNTATPATFHSLQGVFRSILPQHSVQLAQTTGGRPRVTGGRAALAPFPADSALCPTGFALQSFLVPEAWWRNQFAASIDRTITFTVPGHGTASSTFTTHEPYTGWSLDSVTGLDDGTHGGAAGNFEYTRVSLCRFIG